ncbi:hypothetical protein SALBM311S_08516 [Streptomyces alboniger]
MGSGPLSSSQRAVSPPATPPPQGLQIRRAWARGTLLHGALARGVAKANVNAELRRAHLEAVRVALTATPN